MGALNEIGQLLIVTIFTLYLLAITLRLLLQSVRADFYNPISQWIVKLTNPVLLPLRRLVPAVGRLDTASVLLMLLAQMLAIALTALLLGAPLPNPAVLLYWAVLGCIGLITNIFFVAIIAVIVLSWIAPGNYNPMVILLHQLTEPVLVPFRRLLPPIGGMDLSPLLLFLLINIIEIVLRHLATGAGLHPALVIGI